MATNQLAIVLGTFNRREYLERAVESIRATTESVDYLIVVIDGGSTDGSRAWLAEQPDVALIAERGELRGAVRAFNLGFHLALDRGYEYIGNLNDDVECLTPGMWRAAIDAIEADPTVGGVAFAFNTWGNYQFDRYNGNTYLNYGVLRADVGRRCAIAQGDPGGTKLWNEDYRTYAADTELGLQVANAGYKIIEHPDSRVFDSRPQDNLRAGNSPQTDVKTFTDRWPVLKPKNIERAWHKWNKLHIGCGDKHIPGWMNVDGLPTEASDCTLDLYNTDHIPSETAQWIYCSHVIEHIHPDKLVGVLSEFRRIMTPQARLTIATIDFEGIYENRYKAQRNGSAWNAALYGETTSNAHQYAAHRQCFDEALLTRYLNEAGFREVRSWEPEQYPQIRKLNDYAVSCRLVSLLLEAVK